MEPLAKFGLITDLQYADIGNRMYPKGSQLRFYRNSLEILKRAVRTWKSTGIDFILHLGDLIDGLNATEFHFTESAAADVSSVIRKTFPTLPVFYVVGNHELYNYSRKELSTVFPFPDCFDIDHYTKDGARACYFKPLKNFAVIIVDNYDFSVLGNGDPSIYKEAEEFLATKQRNRKSDTVEGEIKVGSGSFFDRYGSHNGSLSNDQMAWLDAILNKADESGIRVVVAGHLPVEPNSCTPGKLDWQYDKILSIIRGHNSVVAYLSGHSHEGGYFCDVAGIHHITVQAVVETPPEVDCYATVEIFPDYLKITGYGRILSRICKFR